MPRYFITTSDGFQADDKDGIELPDGEAVAKRLRKTLLAIMAAEGGEGVRNAFWADAHDEHGNRVMAAKISLTIVKL